MKTVIVDSDVVIEVLRRRDLDIASRWERLANLDVAVLYSPVTAAEIWRGARPSEHETIEALFSGMLCVPIQADIGRGAGEYLRRYSASHGVELGDALIAASAASAKASLWTRNRKHYPMRDIDFY